MNRTTRRISLATAAREAIKAWDINDDGYPPSVDDMAETILEDNGCDEALSAFRDGLIEASDVRILAHEDGSIEVEEIRSPKPRRKIEIETHSFEWSHGRKPRGRGGWMFHLVRATGCDVTPEYIKGLGHPDRIAGVDACDDAFRPNVRGHYVVSTRSMIYADAAKEISTVVRLLEANGAFYRVVVLP